MNKTLAAILLLLAMLESVSVADEVSKATLYQITVDKPGLRVTIQETERQSDYSILQQKSIEVGPVGGGLLLLEAAGVIGKQLNKTHFFVVGGDVEEDLLLYKIYFTSNPSIHPNEQFGDELTAQQLESFTLLGYLPVTYYQDFLEIASQFEQDDAN